MPVTKYGPFVLQFRNFDRQKAFFIRYSRKFRETSSDNMQAGTKPFYGGNFYEISDDGAPLTVFEVHFMNAYYRVPLLHINGYKCFLKGCCREGSVESLCSYSIPVILVSPTIVDTHVRNASKES